jgi:hypothetical protein
MDEETKIPVQSVRPNRSANELPTLEWQAFEYDYKEKTNDWFWVVGVGGFIAIILAIIFKNFLFAIVLLLGTFVTMMYGARKPELITFAIGAKGVTIKNDLYPYKNLIGYGLKVGEGPDKLMLHIDRLFLPHLILPIEDIDAELIRERLGKFLPEEEFEESPIDLFIEYLGF